MMMVDGQITAEWILSRDTCFIIGYITVTEHFQQMDRQKFFDKMVNGSISKLFIQYEKIPRTFLGLFDLMRKIQKTFISEM